MNRFEEIKRSMAYAIEIGEFSRGDAESIQWLISEVERLKEENDRLKVLPKAPESTEST